MKQNKLIKKYKKLILSNIFIPTIVSAFISILLKFNEISFYYLIPVVITIIFVAIFEINKNYFISVTFDEEVATLKYFNYLFKIETRIIDKHTVFNSKNNKRANYIVFELPNNEVLKIRYLKDQPDILKFKF